MALGERLEAPISTKVPRNPPDLFVRLDPSAPRMTGPTSQDSLMAVQVYGRDQEDVINVIGAIRFLLVDEIYALDQKIIWWSEESGPHEFPDPDTAEFFRWQTTGVLTTTLT